MPAVPLGMRRKAMDRKCSNEANANYAKEWLEQLCNTRWMSVSDAIRSSIGTHTH